MGVKQASPELNARVDKCLCGATFHIVQFNNRQTLFNVRKLERDMAALSIGIAFIVRLMLVLLFLPFSALDKIIDFKGAVRQCEESAPSKIVATLLIVGGLCIEVFMSAGVLLGIADRAAAFVLAAYCVLTALLWKQFWRPGDFWTTNESQARNLFWDFWKNVALAGGFLLITFGTGAQSVETFFADPLSSTRPYFLTQGTAR